MDDPGMGCARDFSHLMRATPNSVPLSVGDKVDVWDETDDDGNVVWDKGTIAADNGDYTYDVTLEDGEHIPRVDGWALRAIRSVHRWCVNVRYRFHIDTN